MVINAASLTSPLAALLRCVTCMYLIVAYVDCNSSSDQIYLPPPMANWRVTRCTLSDPVFLYVTPREPQSCLFAMLGGLFDDVGLHRYGTCQLEAPSTLPSTLITQPFWYAFYDFVCFPGLPAVPVDICQ